MTDRPQILANREQTHGDFRVTAAVSTTLHDTIVGSWVGETPATIMECLSMTCTKLGRITAGNALAREHWEDIIGYAQLALEECDRQAPKVRPKMKPISEMTDDELADELRPEAG